MIRWRCLLLLLLSAAWVLSHQCHSGSCFRKPSWFINCKGTEITSRYSNWVPHKHFLLKYFSENNQHWPVLVFFLDKFLRIPQSPATDNLIEEFPSTLQHVLKKLSPLLQPSLWKVCCLPIFYQERATSVLHNIRIHFFFFFTKGC